MQRKGAQKRGIDQSAVRLVMAFGKKKFDGRGGVRYLMTADSMASLCHVVGQTQQVEALAGVYVVVSADGETVITVCHRHN